MIELWNPGPTGIQTQICNLMWPRFGQNYWLLEQENALQYKGTTDKSCHKNPCLHTHPIVLQLAIGSMRDNVSYETIYLGGHMLWSSYFCFQHQMLRWREYQGGLVSCGPRQKEQTDIKHSSCIKGCYMQSFCIWYHLNIKMKPSGLLILHLQEGWVGIT